MFLVHDLPHCSESNNLFFRSKVSQGHKHQTFQNRISTISLEQRKLLKFMSQVFAVFRRKQAEVVKPLYESNNYFNPSFHMGTNYIQIVEILQF